MVGRYGKVFTIPALWDYNYHHFIVDSLVRLSRNLRYLRSNKDILIHVRSYEEYDPKYSKNAAFKEKAKRMREMFFTLLGISTSRIITGPVLADEVFIPRFMKCSYLMSNPAELRILNKQLGVATNIFLVKHPTIRDDLFSTFIIGTPEPRGKHTRTEATLQMKGLNANKTKDEIRSFAPDFASLLNKKATWKGNRKLARQERSKMMIVYQEYTSGPSTDTQWNNETVKTIANAFRKEFTQHEIFVMSSLEADSDNYCLACDIARLGRVDVFVAAHGSGLANMIFLRPGSVVVEVVGVMTAAQMPVCGYYGPMAAGLGHHHYIYAYDFADKKPMLPQLAASKSAAFYNFVRRPGPKENVVKAVMAPKA
jgi:hypothetical protein